MKQNFSNITSQILGLWIKSFQKFPETLEKLSIKKKELQLL